MRYILCFILLISYPASTLLAQNTTLAQQLKEMEVADQAARNNMLAMRETHDENSPEMQKIRDQIMAVDRQYNATLKQILKQHGFPGYKLVGKEGSDNFWLLVQHQDEDTAFQKQVLVLMGKAVKANDASRSSYALLVDRVRVNTGQKQLYGSQCRLNKDKTGFEPEPIEDAAHVDARRAEMELPPLDIYLQTIEDQYRMHLKR